MEDVINALIGILSNLWKAVSDWVAGGIKTFVEWFLSILNDFLTWLFDFILSILNAITLPGWLADPSSIWGGLPAEVIHVLSKCGVGTVLLILSGAIGIRVVINLIPSWASRI